MDLATAFLERCLHFCADTATVALVTPQNWLFLKGYKSLRGRLIVEQRWNLLARLGPGAFETISGEIVNVVLFVAENTRYIKHHMFIICDASSKETPTLKRSTLMQSQLLSLDQLQQLGNPDSRIVLGTLSGQTLLSEFAIALSGLLTGDATNFNRYFWEVAHLGRDWEYLQGTVDETVHFGGREEIVFWEQERGRMYRLAERVRHLNHVAQNWLRGKPSWGKRGVCVNQMGDLSSTIYLGDRYDCNATAIIPKDEDNLLAIWAFCSSEEFREAVQNIDQSIKKTASTLLKIPFDLERWHQIAAVDYPNGLPEPHSKDPTQWLFEGHPIGSNDPLQVAVARLLDYHWPDQEPDKLDSLVPQS